MKKNTYLIMGICIITGMVLCFLIGLPAKLVVEQNGLWKYEKLSFHKEKISESHNFLYAQKGNKTFFFKLLLNADGENNLKVWQCSTNGYILDHYIVNSEKL